MNAENIKIWFWIGVIVVILVMIFSGDKSEDTSTIRNQSSTKENCHPSYSGCLNPNASDYDCAGGSGNGPYYTGRVKVIGPDVFGLDRDRDGWGCE